MRYTFSLKSGDEEETAQQPMSVGKILLFIAGGLAALIFGGKMFVSGASDMARAFGSFLFFAAPAGEEALLRTGGG